MRSPSDDDVLPSDTAFEMFLATTGVDALCDYEKDLYRHHRYERLKESN